MFFEQEFEGKTYLEIAQMIVDAVAGYKGSLLFDRPSHKLTSKGDAITIVFQEGMRMVDNPKAEPGKKIPGKVLQPSKKDAYYLCLEFRKKGTYAGQKLVAPNFIGEMQIIVDLDGPDSFKQEVRKIIEYAQSEMRYQCKDCHRLHPVPPKACRCEIATMPYPQEERQFELWGKDLRADINEKQASKILEMLREKEFSAKYNDAPYRLTRHDLYFGVETFSDDEQSVSLTKEEYEKVLKLIEEN